MPYATELTSALFIALFVLVGAGIVFVTLGIARLLAPRNPSEGKLAIYECGEVPYGNTDVQYNVNYYLFAIMFVVFDVEVAFFFPWAVAFGDLGWFGFWSMMVFLGVLTVGFIYEWRKGALEWD